VNLKQKECENMNLTKKVISRKGNVYFVKLQLDSNPLVIYEIEDIEGKILLKGVATSRHKGENSLIKEVQDLVLMAEENYKDYDALKSFEDWDGVIH
jgi:hypothetical protein